MKREHEEKGYTEEEKEETKETKLIKYIFLIGKYTI
jgi:hypothetical protein